MCIRDSYVGELDSAETRGLLFVQNELERGTLTVKGEGGVPITAELEKSHTAVTVEREEMCIRDRQKG